MLEEPKIKTKSFQIDRRSYLKARLSDISVEGLKRLVPLWVGLGLVLVIPDLEDRWRSILQVLLVVLTSLFVFVLIITTQKVLDPKQASRYCAYHYFEFTEHEIYCKLDGFGESRFSWKLIAKAVEFKNWTFLMQDATAVAALPNFAFTNNGDLEEFRAMAQRKTIESKLAGKARKSY